MNETLSGLLRERLGFLSQPETGVGLHDPHFSGHDEISLGKVVGQGFVSTAGDELITFRRMLKEYLQVEQLELTTSGTSALTAALEAVGVKPGDEVIVPTLTFAATAHAVLHANAIPVFIDIDEHSLGLCPAKLEFYLKAEFTRHPKGGLRNKRTGNRLSSLVVVHVLGGQADSERLLELANEYDLKLVEDAAEAIGSFDSKRRPLGTLGHAGIASFNGNKIITTGQGGAVYSNSDVVAEDFRRIVGTGKLPHPWKFSHSFPGRNIRMPNINAALGLTQLKRISKVLETKREIHKNYLKLLGEDFRFFKPQNADGWNHWLTTIILDSLGWEEVCEQVLEPLTKSGVGVRPLWKPLHMNSHLARFQRLGSMSVAEKVSRQFVSLPSGLAVLPLMAEERAQ